MQLRKNIVCKQQLHFNYNGNADPFTIQQQVNEAYDTVINSVVEKVLKRYENIDEIISIDTMAINIDLHNDEDWQKSLAATFEKEFKEQLAGKAETGMVTRKQQDAFFESLIYFLKHGVLSWNAPVACKPAFDKMLADWVKNIEEVNRPPLIRALESGNAVNRFVNILCDDDFKTAVRFLFKGQLSNNMLDDAVILIKNISQQKNKLKTSKLLKGDLVRISVTGMTGAFAEQELVAWCSKVCHEGLLQEGQVNIEAIKSPVIKKVIGQLKTGKEQLINISKPVKNDFEKPGMITGGMADGVYINNAGAVIIAVFLPALFENTGLSKSGNITSREKALSLIHYCITSDTNPAEFDLLLPKILCGMLPDEVADVPAELSAEQTKEADTMLASVIEHWSVLKNTSIDGLRQSFLQRNGKLSFKGEDWLLQVEQQGYDMLLRQLPWNISMIKLSWMKNLLYTEWIY